MVWWSDVGEVVLQVTGFAEASLWSMWYIHAVILYILAIANGIVYGMTPSHLRSWWNVCWGVFLITWRLVFLLSIESLVFMGIYISTSWVNWWSLVASFSTGRWLSVDLSQILLSWYNSRRWQVHVSCFASVFVSWRRDLGATLDSWWNSQISLALEPWLWCLSCMLMPKFGEINGVLLDLVLCNCW